MYNLISESSNLTVRQKEFQVISV